MSYIIYTAETPNGSKYVGLTKQGLRARKSGHIRSLRKDLKSGKKLLPMQRALKKYGDKLTWTVIDTCKTKKQAIELEQFWIKTLNTFKKGLNCTLGGEGTFGNCAWNKDTPGCFSEEAIAKMRKAKLGKKRGPPSKAVREKIARSNRGKRRLDKPWNLGLKMNSERYNRYLKEHNVKEINLFEAICVRPHTRNYSGIWKKGKFIKKFRSQVECAKFLGVVQSSVRSVLAGRSNQVKGYIPEEVK